MVQLSLEILFGMLPNSKRQKYMSRQLFEIRPTRFVRFDTSVCTSAKARRTTEDYSKDYSGHLKSSRWRYCKCLHKFAGVILRLGTSVNRLVVMRIKVDPKLVKFAKKAAEDKLLGYWLPWLKLKKKQDWSRAFLLAQKAINAPLLFVDLEPDFEAPRAIEAIQELSSTENWKTGIHMQVKPLFGN